MLNIFKRIFIGVTVGLLIFLIKSNVFADTTVSGFHYRYQYVSWPDTTNTVTSNYTAFSTLSPYISGKFKYVWFRVSTTSGSSNFFHTGRTYIAKFRFLMDPKNGYWVSGFNYAQPSLHIFNGSDYVSSGINMIGYNINTSPTSGSYYSNAIDIEVAFNVTTDTQYVLVRFDFNPPTPEFDYPFFQHGRINAIDGSLTYNTDATITAIENNTYIISGILNTIKSALDGAKSQQHTDAQSIISAIQNIGSQFSGDSSSHGSVGGSLDPYSSSGLEQKESQIDWTVDDDAFDLDLSPFTGIMQFIWLQVNTFINLDPLFLSTILAFLTLSFAALVVGRL